MPLFSDITLTTEAATLVTGVMATLWTALVLLWRAESQRRDREAERDQKMIDELLQVILRHGLKHELPRKLRERVEERESGEWS